jgi:predicted heme/steroid binding protein/uncharacterized membrane protein
MKEFDRKALSEFDGKDGKPVYVAHQGRVIDVSESTFWKGGLHMKRHAAGQDLTTDIQSAPHSTEVLERFTQVGVLKKGEVHERPLPAALSKLLHQFPVLRRHHHPLLVHFPIAFSFAACLFIILRVITGISSFEVTALHCMGAGIVFSPLAIGTGWFTWWLNYLAKPLSSVTIKIWFSAVFMGVIVGAFVWRLAVPDILTSFRAASVAYVLLVFSLVPLVSIIGWFGATLTFPVEKD